MSRILRSLCNKTKARSSKENIPKLICKCAQTNYFPITHCIFDLDGTLLDTGAIYRQIVRDILAEYGFEYTTEMHKQVLGTSSRELCSIMVGHYKLPISPDNLLAKYRSICKQRVVGCRLGSGVQKLIFHLHQRGVAMGMATSSCKEMMEIKTKHMPSFFEVFYPTLTDDDVYRNKPEPEIYLVCANRFKERVSASKCLVFTHSVLGMIAALRAGMQCVVVADRHIPPFAYSQATIMLDTLEDFNPEWFGIRGF